MPVNDLKSSKTRIFYFMTVLLSYMDLTQYHKSAEFPMFCPSKSGSGGVENLLPLSILHRLTQSQYASKINAYRDMTTE